MAKIHEFVLSFGSCCNFVSGVNGKQFFIFTKPFHILVTIDKNFIALTLRKDVIGPLVSKGHASE